MPWTNPTRPNYGPNRPQPPTPDATPRPRPPQPPAPSSDYTRQVTEGGLTAYQQAREGRRWGLPTAQQNYQQTGVFAYNQPVAQSARYDDWLDDMMPSFDPSAEYGFGRGDGDYSGFKTQGALQAAIRGAAEAQRAQDRERFAALDEVANQRLDMYEQQYGDAQDDADEFFRYTDADRPDTTMYANRLLPGGGELTGERLAAETRRASKALAGIADSDFTEAERQGDAWANMAARYTGRGKQEANTDFVNEELNPWLADASAPDAEMQAFAQAGLTTPLRAYAMQAGADYNVDPYIVGGWYDQASAIGDAADQRTLDFLEQTGMTPQDYEQALTDLERQQALDDAAAADVQDAYTEQEQAQIDQAGVQLTGGLATTSELANDTNLPLQEVYDILNSADFQMSLDEMDAALATSDIAQVQSTVVSVLDRAAIADPALFDVLNLIYKDYIPEDYDLYGQR